LLPILSFVRDLATDSGIYSHDKIHENLLLHPHVNWKTDFWKKPDFSILFLSHSFIYKRISRKFQKNLFNIKNFIDKKELEFRISRYFRIVSRITFQNCFLGT